LLLAVVGEDVLTLQPLQRVVRVVVVVHGMEVQPQVLLEIRHLQHLLKVIMAVEMEGLLERLILQEAAVELLLLEVMLHQIVKVEMEGRALHLQFQDRL
jgi:hypothetical protein